MRRPAVVGRILMTMTLELLDKRALVGGASRGIGLGCAHSLAKAGATVTLMARDPDALTGAARDLPTPVSQTHEVLPQDSADWRGIHVAVSAHVEENGTIEILVHNTGGPPPGPAIDAEPEQFDTAFDMHIMSGQALVRALVPGMRESGYGRIINIISSSVVTPLPNLGVSNTIRGAVAQWGRTLAAELAADGITVNNLLPGSIDTTRLRTTMRRIAHNTGSTVDEVEERTIKAIPTGRLGEPSDIGSVVAFLASPAAAYVNGVNLPVDGGKTAVQ